MGNACACNCDNIKENEIVITDKHTQHATKVEAEDDMGAATPKSNDDQVLASGR
jgi:hypothetical protein